MNMNSKKGSGSFSAFLVILLVASIALNAAFLTGCISLEDFRGKGKEPRPTSQRGPQLPLASEAAYLREIATVLGLSPSSDKTPGDIAFDIEQALKSSRAYKGAVFSDETFKECKAVLPTAKDMETLEAYHTFIKKIAGKRIVILECKE